MEELVSTLLASTPDPRKKRSELATLPFLFAVDHCFSKSGQGTVLTGTVLRGCTRVGEVLLERPYNCLIHYDTRSLSLKVAVQAATARFIEVALDSVLQFSFYLALFH